MRVILATVLLLVAAAPSAADEAADSHRTAAAELLVLMDADSQMMGGAQAIADTMLQQNPTLRPFRDVLLEWATRYLTWEKFEVKLVDMYVDVFTESELREMIAFYNTPTGRKSVEMGPTLMQRGAMLGGEVASEHAAELEAMIEARANELEALGVPGMRPE